MINLDAARYVIYKELKTQPKVELKIYKVCSILADNTALDVIIAKSEKLASAQLKKAIDATKGSVINEFEGHTLFVQTPEIQKVAPVKPSQEVEDGFNRYKETAAKNEKTYAKKVRSRGYDYW